MLHVVDQPSAASRLRRPRGDADVRPQQRSHASAGGRGDPPTPSPSAAPAVDQHTRPTATAMDPDGDDMVGDGSSTYTVDEALVAMGFGTFQALVLAYAGMGWTSEAMEVMILSFVGPAVQEEWKLSSQQESLITSVVFAGMLLGAYTWGIVSDTLGRRMGFLFTALVTSVVGFLSAFAPNYISLIILRFFVGIGLGGGHVLSSWFLEFVPAPNRGTWMVGFSCFWTVGTILEASLAWAVMPMLGWRWLLALSSLPSFLLLLFYGATPESPRYLCMRGKIADATIIMEKIASVNCTTLPSGILISERKREFSENPDPSEDTHLITVQKNQNVSHDNESAFRCVNSLCRLLSPNLMRSTFLLWIVFFGNAFSYYGIVLLTSKLSNGDGKCTSKELQSVHSEDSSLYKDVFITSFAEFPGLLLSAAAVDRIGRKLTMSGMLFMSCIFLIPLIYHQRELFTTILLFGARMCINGSFIILYIYAPEVYPTSIRATGVGIGSSIGRIGGIVCPLVAVGLVDGCHQAAAITLFEFVMVLSGLAICCFPLETKGRELSDTEQSLK